MASFAVFGAVLTGVWVSQEAWARRTAGGGRDQKTPAAAIRHRETRPINPQFTLTVVEQTAESVTLDVLISHAKNVRGYQVALAVEGGDAGRLAPEAVWVDSDREDFLFHGLTAFTATDLRAPRLAGALLSGGVKASQPAYLGSFTFHATPETSGLFEIKVRPREDSLLRDADSRPVPFMVAAPLTIEFPRR
jgi:hypothetical protein